MKKKASAPADIHNYVMLPSLLALLSGSIYLNHKRKADVDSIRKSLKMMEANPPWYMQKSDVRLLHKVMLGPKKK